MRNTDSGMLSPGWAGVDVSIVDDQAWIDAALRVETALARCQARLGMIPSSAAATIDSVAGSLRLDPRSLAESVALTSNPAIDLIRQLQLAADQAVPGTSDYVHLGATSQDIFDIATMLVCRRALGELQGRLAEARGHLVGLIGRHGSAPMVGRTVSQHAVPITLGVKASAWLNAIIDAESEVRDLLARGLPLSLAGASGTLAAFGEYGTHATGSPVDPFQLVDAVADELGLVPHYQPWHTVRSPIAKISSVLSLASGALGKVAADIHVMSRTEISEVAEGLPEGGGISSSMPQKCNPVKTVLVLAAARQVPAFNLVLQQSMVAEDERPVGAWQAEWQPLREALRLVLGGSTHLAELIGGLRIDEERMLHNLRSTGAAVISERLNATLTPLVGKANAKQLLRRLLLEGSSDPETLVGALREELSSLGVDHGAIDLDRLLTPEDYIGSSAEITRRALRRDSEFSGDNRRSAL